MNGLDEGFHFVLDRKAALGEFDLARQLIDPRADGVAPAFEADHRVVLLDLPGSADADPSSYDPVRHASLQGYADDVLLVLDELGLAPAPSVETLGEDNAGQFFGTVSAEQADTFDDVDLIVAYGDQTLLDQLQADPLLGTIPAIERGAVALLTDGTPLAAALTPTPLSIPWALDEYVAVFDAAAQNAQ